MEQHNLRPSIEPASAPSIAVREATSVALDLPRMMRRIGAHDPAFSARKKLVQLLEPVPNCDSPGPRNGMDGSRTQPYCREMRGTGRGERRAHDLRGAAVTVVQQGGWCLSIGSRCGPSLRSPQFTARTANVAVFYPHCFKKRVGTIGSAIDSS